MTSRAPGLPGMTTTSVSVAGRDSGDAGTVRTSAGFLQREHRIEMLSRGVTLETREAKREGRRQMLECRQKWAAECQNAPIDLLDSHRPRRHAVACLREPLNARSCARAADCASSTGSGSRTGSRGHRYGQASVWLDCCPRLAAGRRGPRDRPLVGSEGSHAGTDTTRRGWHGQLPHGCSCRV